MISPRPELFTPTLQNRLLTEKQVAELTTISVWTLRRWRCVGSGPAFVKLGPGPKARVGYHPVDIEKYVNQGRRLPSVRAAREEQRGSKEAR